MNDEFIQLVMTGIRDNQISIHIKYDPLRIKQATVLKWYRGLCWQQ